MKELLIVLSMLHGADATTTVVALNRGAREANPMLPQNAALNLGINAGMTSVGTFALYKMNQRHPKVAKGLAWVLIGVEGFTAAHNFQVVKQQGRQ